MLSKFRFDLLVSNYVLIFVEADGSQGSSDPLWISFTLKNIKTRALFWIIFGRIPRILKHKGLMVVNWSSISFQLIHPAKTNMTIMEKQPFEDVSPIRNGDFPASHISF